VVTMRLAYPKTPIPLTPGPPWAPGAAAWSLGRQRSAALQVWGVPTTVRPRARSAA
jgi:hypothetical protein